MALKEQLNEAVGMVLKGAKCILCKHPEVVQAGMHVPSREGSRMLGLPPNTPLDMRRVAIYGLCRDCKDLPDLDKRVGEAVFNRVAPSRN